MTTHMLPTDLSSTSCADRLSNPHRRRNAWCGTSSARVIRTGRVDSQAGLTLIEIMVVLIILSLVMAWLGTGLFAKGDEAKQRLTQLKIKEVANLIGQFQLQYNKLPNSMEDLTRCTEVTGQNCIPVTSEEKLVDAWNNKFIYTTEESGRRYRIKSLGRDGREGGEGADADLFGTGP